MLLMGQVFAGSIVLVYEGSDMLTVRIV